MNSRHALRSLISGALLAIAAAASASARRHLRYARRRAFQPAKTRARRRISPRPGRERQDPGRDPPDRAARQAGLSRVLRRARCRDQAADDRRHHLPAVFDDQADHLGCGDDADRRGQAEARRSRRQIHPVIRQRQGRRREEGRQWREGARPCAAEPADHDAGPDDANLRHRLRLLWRQHGPQGLCQRQDL